MQGLFSAGKEFLESQQGGGNNDSQEQGQGQGQGQYGVQGGPEYNRPSGGQNQDVDGPNLQHAAQHAAAQSGGDSDGLFGKALGFIQNQNHNEPINEEQATSSHTEAYQNGNASSLDASSMGAAAAMQALKKFTSGGGDTSGGGGDMQSKLVGMAMSEAAQLFESAGGAASGDKQTVIASAGETMMKMVIQSKMSGMFGTGGGSSGGMGSLMGLASKLM